MKSYVERVKKIPVYDEVDVLVVGGGPAGMSAAIAAARQGADTMIIEKYGCFGGVLTHCAVESFAWYRYKNTVEAGGLAKEYEDRYLAEGGINITDEIRPEIDKELPTCALIDPEVFKVVADRMITEAGVKVLLHTYGVDAIVEDGEIKGVIVENKSGRQAIMAKRVIDCTGDADVAKFAGAPFTKQSKDKLMGVTTTLSIKNIDVKKFQDYVLNDLKPTFGDWNNYWGIHTTNEILKMYNSYMDKPLTEGLMEGIVPHEKNVFLGGGWGRMTEEKEITVLNMIFILGIDGTDADDLTNAEITGRRNAMYLLELMRKKVPGMENIRLRNFSMKLGVRETRVIDGKYRLTEKDVTEEGRFDDSIAIFPEFLDGEGYLLLPTTGRYYQIPFGVIVPQKVANLLVAGRCICTDKVARVSSRNMTSCVATGQAAGTAAALSVKEGVCAADVKIEALQDALRQQNVRVD